MTKQFGAMHVDTSDKSCGTWFSFVKAFTLAEVLITLGIIGVVAAMTIPTLVKNYQKTVWVNQLKKSVSILEQGFQKMLADDGVDSLDNSSFRTEMDKAGVEYICDNYDDKYIDFNNYLIKYFKILKFGNGRAGESCTLGYDYKTLDGNNDYRDSDIHKIYLADGSVFGMWLYEKCRTNTEGCGLVGIDVNGEGKGPNQWGRDTFVFRLRPNGHLVAEELNQWFDCESNGFGCADRIIKNGWKMDY